MATFPVTTGDVLTAATYNSLPTFTVGTANTADYTAVLADQYQALQLMNKATAIAFKLPTNASVAFPIGTAITVLNSAQVLAQSAQSLQRPRQSYQVAR